MSGNFVHLDDCDIVAIGNEAILIRYEDEEHWIPKSQMANAEDYKRGMTGRTASITEWIAGKRGLK